jgi:hypothetical protein
MYAKGNILQYKKNSSSLTKQQKYSLIAKGYWVGKKSYSTQSQTYTNPNTTSLQRINYSNIPYPNNIVGYPNNISGPFQYNVANPFNCSTDLLQDGGNLVCNAVVEPCSGNIIQTFKTQKCFSTACSNVPGNAKFLCWDPKIQTWFPKNRTTMNNSGTKWPEGYKGFVSAVKLSAPYLVSATNTVSQTVTLSWTYIYSNCVPVSSFNIYINNVLAQNVSYDTTTTTISGLNTHSTYSFYVKSVGENITSDMSNIITLISIK